MREISVVPFVGVMLAFVIVGVTVLPTFPGASVLTSLPHAPSNRTIKGDRSPAVMPDGRSGPQLQTREKLPFGCDGAFSPVASPSLANISRRCVV
jgi:hypothetical protein